MNRIILIGNGFDLAHDLKTSYGDFMNWYWQKCVKTLFADVHHVGPYEYKDDVITLQLQGELYDASTGELLDDFQKLKDSECYKDIEPLIGHSQASKIVIGWGKNLFWKHLCDKTCLDTWVDVENEYYYKLKKLLGIDDEHERMRVSHGTEPTSRNKEVKRLNNEFDKVKILLKEYLSDICEKELPNRERNEELVEHLFLKHGIERKSVAISKQTAYTDSLPEQKKKLLDMTRDYVQNENEQSEHKKIQAMLTRTPYKRNPLCDMNEEELNREAEQSIERMGVAPERILALNFNYTPTFERLYASCAEVEIINIHGELNNPANPIVFGYGDELDDKYKEIEKANDNDFLDNVKSIAYGNTDNYRRLLEFLQLGSYQVFVMGHSCGNSDRTLLNEIFEHPNCTSIKLFYHDRGNGSDDFSNVYKNISRNFTNKRALRDIVVNKTYCKPLPQSKSAAE